MRRRQRRNSRRASPGSWRDCSSISSRMRVLASEISCKCDLARACSTTAGRSDTVRAERVLRECRVARSFPRRYHAPRPPGPNPSRSVSSRAAIPSAHCQPKRRKRPLFRCSPRASEVARPEGFEPPTSGLEIHRSIQLSYGRLDVNGAENCTRVTVRQARNCGERGALGSDGTTRKQAVRAHCAVYWDRTTTALRRGARV